MDSSLSLSTVETRAPHSAVACTVMWGILGNTAVHDGMIYTTLAMSPLGFVCLLKGLQRTQLVQLYTLIDARFIAVAGFRLTMVYIVRQDFPRFELRDTGLGIHGLLTTMLSPFQLVVDSVPPYFGHGIGWHCFFMELGQ